MSIDVPTCCALIASSPPNDMLVNICMFLQRGIDLPSLDVSYFTSLSYYMLLLFGLRGVMSLMFKEDTIDETQLQKQQMTMGVGSLGQDPQKAFEQERTALDTVCIHTQHSIHFHIHSHCKQRCYHLDQQSCVFPCPCHADILSK